MENHRKIINFLLNNMTPIKTDPPWESNKNPVQEIGNKNDEKNEKNKKTKELMN